MLPFFGNILATFFSGGRAQQLLVDVRGTAAMVIVNN